MKSHFKSEYFIRVVLIHPGGLNVGQGQPPFNPDAGAYWTGAFLGGGHSAERPYLTHIGKTSVKQPPFLRKNLLIPGSRISQAAGRMIS